MSEKHNKSVRDGGALLVVLFIVMVITVLSLGFLSRSDVELACGRNMVLRTKVDYLAESGLEHARGLILNPQDVDSEYWTGGMAQQLVAGSDDYYDLEINCDATDSTDYCNYIIDCNAYVMKKGERVGFSSIRANLRLDPCIALWTGADTVLLNGVTINGDVFCDGALINAGTLNGDVFAETYSGSKTGQFKSVEDLSISWPRVTIMDYTSHYSTENITSGSISGQTLGSIDPVRVCYYNNDLELAGNVQIDGMLLVDGDLVIRNNQNKITAAKNLPALLVTGNLIMGVDSELEVNGLAVVDGDMRVNAGTNGVNILGGLFIRGTLIETATDSSGSNNDGILCGDLMWQPAGGQSGGALQFNGDSSAVEISTKDMNPLQGTVSLWIYANDFDNNNHYLFGHTSLSSWRDRIQLYTNDEYGWLDLGLGDTHSRHTNIQNLDEHRWYHIALTWDGTNYVVYVDGAEKANGSYTGLSSLGDIADIGNTGNPAYRDESFIGVIDEVRMYNRVLDANDIYPPVDGLVGLIGYWKLDESGGSITVTAAPSKTAIKVWSEEGDIEKWGQAAGAFFRSIERK
jgi:cytoskeletal protein CcmA (bactofilin family)